MNNKSLKILGALVLIIVAFYLFTIIKQKKEIAVSNPVATVSPYLNSKIDIKTFKSADNTYGYDVFIDGMQYVHQPNIPALAGDTGFKSEADAQKVARFVVKKIRGNDLPPSITPEELKSLGI